MGKFDEAPPLIRDFLVYDEAVRGKAGTTTDEYYSDLKTFFRYIKMEKGLSPTGQPMEEIDISDVDISLIRQLTLSDLYSFMIYCKSERGNNETTRARKTVCLRMFFKYLTTKAGLLTVNPAEQLELPKARKSLPKYLTLEQSVALLESVDKASPNYQRDYCILTLFLNCGLRLAELCGLNLSDIRSDGTMRVVGKGDRGTHGLPERRLCAGDCRLPEGSAAGRAEGRRPQRAVYQPAGVSASGGGAFRRW